MTTVTIPADDAAYNIAPARTVSPCHSVRPQPPRPVVAITPTTMRLGHGVRVDESKSLIGAGWL